MKTAKQTGPPDRRANPIPREPDPGSTRDDTNMEARSWRGSRVRSERTLFREEVEIFAGKCSSKVGVIRSELWGRNACRPPLQGSDTGLTQVDVCASHCFSVHLYARMHIQWFLGSHSTCTFRGRSMRVRFAPRDSAHRLGVTPPTRTQRGIQAL